MDRYRIGPMVWGSLLIWIGIMLIIDEPAGVASMGAGVIFLAGAAWRRTRGYKAGFLLSANGFLLLVLGINDLNGDDNGIPLVATTLIALGALIVTKAIAFRLKMREVGLVIRSHRDPFE